jgi:hypothetical protein
VDGEEYKRKSIDVKIIRKRGEVINRKGEGKECG